MDIQNDFSDKSDEELVELSLENQNVFVHLVSRYKLKLFSYVRRISNFDAEEAEDILQDVFLKTYLNLNDFDGNLKFSSWIYRIAHNQVISEFRRRSARPQSAGIDLTDDRVLQIAADFDIEKGVDQLIKKEKIRSYLDKLDEKCKDILVLKYFEEKDYKEISDILKIPMGTVASRINKAKKELSSLMAPDK